MSLTVYPTIVFDSGTGSDTAASGAGPSVAVTGTAAAHTGGVASTTITFTNSPDLSGVAQDGSAILWLVTASGRQFTRISTVDNVGKTCVVEDSFTIAAGSAVNYAIGGKRATWDNTNSRLLFSADGKVGWTAQTNSAQSLTSTLVIATQIVVQGNTDVPQPTITQTANAAVLNPTNGPIRIASLKLCNSNATKTSADGVLLSGGGVGMVVIVDCVIGDATNTIHIGINGNGPGGRITAIDCEILKCTSCGVQNNNATQIEVVACKIHDNTSDGINQTFNADLVVRKSEIYNNGGKGISHSYGLSLSSPVRITENTIHGNTGDGVKFTCNFGSAYGVKIYGNCITKNGSGTGYGINNAGSVNNDLSIYKIICDYNCFGSATDSTANVSGTYNGLTAGTHDLINVSPQYTNAAGGDFTTGVNVQAKGWPDSTRSVGANTGGGKSFVDIGALQQQATAGTVTVPLQQTVLVWCDGGD